MQYARPEVDVSAKVLAVRNADHDRSDCMKANEEASVSEAGREPQRWMILPSNPAYPHFDEVHREDEWCAKVGCVPINDSCVIAGKRAESSQPAGPATLRGFALDVVDAIEWLDQGKAKEARSVLCELRDKLRREPAGPETTREGL